MGRSQCLSSSSKAAGSSLAVHGRAGWRCARGPQMRGISSEPSTTNYRPPLRVSGMRTRDHCEPGRMLPVHIPQGQPVKGQNISTGQLQNHRPEDSLLPIWCLLFLPFLIFSLLILPAATDPDSSSIRLDTSSGNHSQSPN